MPTDRLLLPDGASLRSAVQNLVAQADQMRSQATALRITKSEVDEKNNALLELYDLVPVPYLLLSATGVIMRANESALEMLGVSRVSAVGRPLVAFLDSGCTRKVLESILFCRPGQPQVLEAVLGTTSGRRPVHITIQRGSGQATTYRVAMVDLSEVRRLEEERRRAEAEREESVRAERAARAASEAKDQFLAMLSHELRTPLTPILAAADTLMSTGALSSDVQAAIAVIRRNVKSEARLIDDLLDVARINRDALVVERHPADVHLLLGEVAQAWRRPLEERQIALEVGLASTGHWVWGDAPRLAQVFQNLLNNAAKFTHEGGRITVKSETASSGLRVIVTDNGIGIAPDTLGRLFSPFFRSQESMTRGGLGLGLVISKGIVEAHGGTLTLLSAGTGEGTSAVVELPTMTEAEVGQIREKKDAAAPVEPPDGRHRVLLVEDDQDTALMLTFLLESQGYPVQVGRSVREAKRMADGCDLIVSDIALPDGSGLELIRDLLQQRPRRAIALSGYGSADDVERSLQAGFSEHLTKPVDLDQLMAALGRLAAK